MEIIYCSKCGQMIPPGGMDKGQRYIRNEEIYCPKCYKLLPPETHTGETIMMEEKGIGKDAWGQAGKKISTEPKKRISSSRTAVTARRPSGRQAQVGSSGKAVIFTVVLVLGLVLAAGAYFLNTGTATTSKPKKPVVSPLAGRTTKKQPPENKPIPTVVRSPAKILSKPEPKKSPPKPRKSSPKQKPPSCPSPKISETSAEDLLAWARAFRKTDPSHYWLALQVFRGVIKKAPDTPLAVEARKAIKSVKSQKREDAKKLLAVRGQQAGKLAAARDFDGAIALFTEFPMNLRALMRKPGQDEANRYSKQAVKILEPACAAVTKLMNENKFNQALAHLEAIKNVKFAPWNQKIADLRKSIEAARKASPQNQ
jgi:hypothetical protein